MFAAASSSNAAISFAISSNTASTSWPTKYAAPNAATTDAMFPAAAFMLICAFVIALIALIINPMPLTIRGTSAITTI